MKQPGTISPGPGQVWGPCDTSGKAPRRHLPLSLPQGFQVAYVVFQKPSGVSAALNLKGPLLVSTESHPVKNGIHSQYRWLCPVLPPRLWVGEGHLMGPASVNATGWVPSS